MLPYYGNAHVENSSGEEWKVRKKNAWCGDVVLFNLANNSGKVEDTEMTRNYNLVWGVIVALSC